MIYLAKASVELIVAILLMVALMTTSTEATKIVHKLTIVITILAAIACITWWFL